MVNSMSVSDKNRIYEIDFNYIMICPYCNEKIQSIIEVFNRRRGTLVSLYRVAHLCPKCSSILGTTISRV